MVLFCTVSEILPIFAFAYICYPSVIRHPRSLIPMLPLEFRSEVNRDETRVMGLSASEDRAHDRSWSYFDIDTGL